MKHWKLAAASALALLAASPAMAADFSFTGNLSDANQVLFFNFAVGAPSTVTLLTYSYAGGTNSAGQTIARGGFDPILSLYDVNTGLRIGQNDDGGSSFVPADAVTGRYYDTYFQSVLDPGSYRVAVSVYRNFGPPTLSGTFTGGGNFVDASGNPRDNHFAFDVLGVQSASLGTPEPGTWALMISGFGLVGAAMRRRTSQSLGVTYA